MEDQFTINPSRASEITMAEDLTTTGGDMFEEFDITGGGFGGEDCCYYMYVVKYFRSVEIAHGGQSIWQSG